MEYARRNILIIWRASSSMCKLCSHFTQNNFNVLATFLRACSYKCRSNLQTSISSLIVRKIESISDFPNKLGVDETFSRF
uniref:Transposase n=1 Tax=Romanomermis culicivorax TaxID=13658 RepID=A0A915IL66_ROMCU